MRARLVLLGPGSIRQKTSNCTCETLASAFSITAFCASNEGRKRATLLDYPAASFETDIATFEERRDVDAVVALTPIHLNVQTAPAALRAGRIYARKSR
jgi:predicted dehydrogenase